MTYFEWLIAFVADEDDSERFSLLFEFLFRHEYIWILPRDRSRASDGVNLRSRYIEETGYLNVIDGECSWLEMLVALSIRGETEIMMNSQYGDRTALWFWTMMESVNLDNMSDDKYSSSLVSGRIDEIINGIRFLWPQVRDVDYSHVEIWYQMLWYFSTICV